MKNVNKVKKFLRQEREALDCAIELVDTRFTKAIELILNSKGKVVVTGVGKSGLVGQKISATLSSTGTPSVYMHSSDAIHGDLGVINKQDVVLAISASGYTAETLEIIPHVRRIGAKIVALTGDPESQLARMSDVTLNTGKPREAGHLGLAPTSSALVAMACGDALATVIAECRGFCSSDFAMFHPGGQLGRQLLLQVKDLMHSGAENPMLRPEASFSQIITKLTETPLGGVNIVENMRSRRLLGIITDGDIRRLLMRKVDYATLKASDIMTANPRTVLENDPAVRAFELMENRKSQISVLPVINTTKNGKCVGMIRLHDLVKIGFKKNATEE
ncbi:KpsF/GutQ family sugar-phosphate isomerase [Candidatus Sumerlaeota bacterium]|nr:KpsF/GutQ family sugar-phosphate isomerase [Candidatus Sumerlaeota bacterium]